LGAGLGDGDLRRVRRGREAAPARGRRGPAPRGFRGGGEVSGSGADLRACQRQAPEARRPDPSPLKEPPAPALLSVSSPLELKKDSYPRLLTGFSRRLRPRVLGPR